MDAGYERFQGMRRELDQAIARLGEVGKDMGQEALAHTAAELRERVATDTFSVLVLGEFNVGKSTTINALLGHKVLPATGKPTTAVLTVVGWAEERRAVLYRIDPHHPDGLDPNGVSVPVADLDRTITVDAGPGRADSWGKAEIGWPLELCRQGVEIVDSPGLNENADRARVTLEFVNRADAVVLVLSALQALSESEREVVDQQLRAFSHDNMFVLVNRVNQVDEDEVDEVVDDLRSRIKEYWGLGEDRVMFVDSLTALKGRKAGEPDRVERSGLPRFEEELERFLTTNRGRLKIVPPALQVQRLVEIARADVDEMSALLDKDVVRLTEEYERQREPLERLRRDRESIGRTIDNHLTATRSQIEEEASRFLRSTAALCPVWAEEMEVGNAVTMNPLKAKQNMEAMVREVVDGLSERVIARSEEWLEGDLADLLTARADDLEERIGERLVAFARDLDDVKSALLEVDGVSQPDTPSTWSRIGGGVGGLLLNPGAAVIGTQFGFKEMVRSLLPQIGISVALALLGFTNPLFFAAVLLGAGLTQTLVKLDRINRRIVETVAKEMADKLSEEARERAGHIAVKAHEQLDEQRRRIDHNLAEAIDAIDEQVQFVLASREEAKGSAERARQRLFEMRRTLTEVDRRAAAVIQGWALA